MLPPAAFVLKLCYCQVGLSRVLPGPCLGADPVHLQ